MTTNALQSLYGGAQSRRALSGNVGGQHRLQEVRTSDWILDAVREAFHGPIAVDPCASTDRANWFAGFNFSVAPEALPLEAELAALKGVGTKPEIAKLRKKLKPFYEGGYLTHDWPPGDAFVNPPFEFLSGWMQRCQNEFATNGRRVIGLWPVRPHRTWWHTWSRWSEVVFLNYNVVFVGHKSAFPAPLCLAAYGCVIPDLGERETGRWRP